MIVHENGVFHLAGKDFSYLFRILPTGQPEQLHFGPAIEIGDVEAFACKTGTGWGCSVAYAKDGTYGRYFHGSSTIDFYSNFIVLELEGLKSRKDLQSVILLCLIFRITKDLEGGDLQTRKMVVIDEAWDLLSHRYAASFIENGYRRARKQNASFITITQSFADYYQNETARAALENADIRIALRQKAESISFLEKEKKLAMSPWEIRQLKSLRLQPDEYAECLVTTPETPAAVLQVRFDAFSRLAYSSNANDVAAIRSLMETGLSLVDAIEALLKEKEGR